MSAVGAPVGELVGGGGSGLRPLPRPSGLDGTVPSSLPAAFPPPWERSAFRDTLRALRAALEGGREGENVIATMTAPVAPLETLFALDTDEDAVLWAPPEGPQWAALGTTESLRGNGARRYRELGAHARATWQRSRVAPLDQGWAPAPRVFGGFSFRPGGAATTPWAAFGDARFALPTTTYAVDGSRAALLVAAPPRLHRDRRARAALVAQTAQVLEALAAAAAQPRAREEDDVARRPAAVHEMGEAEWSRLVQGIRALIAEGRSEKIVAARCVRFDFPEAIDPVRVLHRLRRSARSSTRFALRAGSATFLGATPERLIAKQGQLVSTEALAGTIRSGDAGQSEALLGNAKELGEHEIVAREIVRCLEPLCTSLSVPERPRVRELRHLLHLHTPIEARLASPRHILELVERLHPTPAVAGFPTVDALEWIARHEPAERGWYAAPIGWFDASGDGELVVALRSGLLTAKSAYLYAGCGIVRDSDPRSEYAETRLKLTPLCAALGLAPPSEAR